jgi:hypothetical protein
MTSRAGALLHPTYFPADLKLGILINFNVPILKEGIT